MDKGQTLSDQYELIIAGGFHAATDVKSCRRDNLSLRANHEEAGTRLILHSCEAFKTGCEIIIVNSRDTDVMLLLLHFVSKEAREVWMISGTAKKRR